MKTDVVVISHVSLDVYSDNLYLGGPASYCGRLLDELGANYLVIGMIGKEFPFRDYYKEKIKNSIFVESANTTTFLMKHINNVRDIKIISLAGEFDIEKMPGELKNARYVLLSPIVDDMSIHFISQLSKKTSAILCIDPFNNDDGKFTDDQKNYFLSLVENVEIIKLSKNELLGLSGLTSLDSAVKNYLSKFKNTFIITLGPNGALIYKNDLINKVVGGISLYSPIDTTGCGDIFFAGFIYAIVQGYSLENSVLFGNVCAGLSVDKKGVDSVPIKKDVFRVYESLI